MPLLTREPIDQVISFRALTTNKRNDVAIATYTKLGFAAIESVCTDIGSGYVMDDFIVELRT